MSNCRIETYLHDTAGSRKILNLRKSIHIISVTQINKYLQKKFFEIGGWRIAAKAYITVCQKRLYIGEDFTRVT